MFRKIALLIGLIGLSLSTIAQNEMDPFSQSKENPFKRTFEDSTFVFKAINNVDQLLIVQFDNLKSWENLKLNYQALSNTLKKTSTTITEEINDLSRDRSIIIRYISDDQQLISISEHQPNTKIRYMDNSDISIVKSGMDTVSIIHSKKMGDKAHSISYTFIIDDVLEYENLQLKAFQPFIDSLDALLNAYIIKKKNPYGRHHQLVGNYLEKEGQIKSKNMTLLNQTLGRIFFDYSMGIYTGYNLPTAFIGEATFGVYLDKTQRDNYIFAGITTGSINPHVVNNKMESSGYLALEIGTIPKRKYLNIINGGRLSMSIGIYQPWMRGNQQSYFDPKPAFYTGFNVPAFKYLQVGFHVASDLQFNERKADYNKYLFGISLKASLGSMVNSLYN